MKKISNQLLTFLFVLFLFSTCSKEEEPTPPPPIVKFTLTTQVSPAGRGTISPSSGSFEKGSDVSLKATPSSKFRFKEWTGSVTGSNNPTTLAMNSNKTITAVFEEVTYVPDDNFEQALIDLGIDDVLDDYVPTKNIKDIIKIELSKKEIQDLTGIEDFIALKHLDVWQNQLTSIDVSKNLNLTWFSFSVNQISSIDISNNTKLDTLTGRTNQLTSLDISKNTNLKLLSVLQNQLTSLDISKNNALTWLKCFDNQLTNLDVSHNPALITLITSNNQLTCIQVNQEQIVNIPDTWYKDEDVQYAIDCSDPNAGKTYVPDDNFEQALIDLGYDNYLDDYVFTFVIKEVEELNLSEKNISDLTGIEDFTSLTKLYCSQNQLTSLDVSNNLNLEVLNFAYNQITSIDISKNTSLHSLWFISNQISTIDLSNNSGLIQLDCQQNQLTTIDVSNIDNLLVFWSGGNQLSCIQARAEQLINMPSGWINNGNAYYSEDCSVPPRAEAPEGTEWVTTSINESEIGGSELSVRSAYYSDSPIQDGKIETIISQSGTQVVLVVDNNDKIRGLTYSLESGSEYRLEEVDATSTINSLFLLNPGLISTSSAQTIETINKLESLSSYNIFKSEIINKLQSQSLEELLIDNNINTLFRNVISEFYTEYVESLYENKPNIKNKSQGIFRKFSVEKNIYGQVEIKNPDWRIVNVFRSYVENGIEIETELIIEKMDGAKNASFGNLLFFRIGDPTIEIDTGYSPPTQNSETDYWIVAPGFGKTDVELPNYIDGSISDLLGPNIIHNLLLPIIDLGLGIDGAINLSNETTSKFKTAKILWDAAKGGVDFYNLIDAINTNPDDLKTISAISMDVAYKIFKILLASGTITVSPLAATVIAGIGVGLAGTNVVMFILDLSTQPKYSKYSIATQIFPPTLLSPQNGAQNQPTPITLSWEKNPIAWEYRVEIDTNSDFSNPKWKTTDGITMSHDFDDLQPSTTYYWRVICFKGNGSPSEWSDVWSFTTTSNNSSTSDILFNPNLTYGTVTDIDGNTYKTIQIGNQTWMAENLRVTKYRNGDPITYVSGDTEWSNLSSEAYCNAYNDNVPTYGRLYNGYCVNDSRNICPEGWHIPTDAEWKELEIYLGMSEYDANESSGVSYRNSGSVGDKLKEVGSVHWSSQDNNGNNNSGFTALPVGWRSVNGNIYNYGSGGIWWTSSTSIGYNDFRAIGTSQSGIKRSYMSVKAGGGVRCIKD